MYTTTGHGNVISRNAMSSFFMPKLTKEYEH